MLTPVRVALQGMHDRKKRPRRAEGPSLQQIGNFHADENAGLDAFPPLVTRQAERSSRPQRYYAPTAVSLCTRRWVTKIGDRLG